LYRWLFCKRQIW